MIYPQTLFKCKRPLEYLVEGLASLGTGFLGFGSFGSGQRRVFEGSGTRGGSPVRPSARESRALAEAQWHSCVPCQSTGSFGA